MTAPDRIAPPPAYLFARARTRLFAGPGASLVTLVLLGALAWAGWRLLAWGVIDAVAAPDYATCKSAPGACWGFVAEKWRLIVFGRYPYEQQWRPGIATGAVLAMLVASALPALWSRRGARALALGWSSRCPFTLMFGGVFGLEPVGTDRWAAFR
jgi:general L-amino acid transport system permease protein